MAKEQENEEQEEKEKAGGGNKKAILIIALVAVVCLLLGGGGGYLLFSGGEKESKSAAGGKKSDKASKSEKSAEEHADEETTSDEEAATDAEEGEEETEESGPKPPAQYSNMKPLTINYTVNGKPRYLQASISVMSRDPAVNSFVEANQPLLQNNLLLIMGNYSFDQLGTLEGKEKLRAACFDEVQKVIHKELGEERNIEQVLFFNFILQ